MEPNKTQKLITDETSWAYAVLDSYVEAFNRVASAKPEELPKLRNQLLIECQQKLPELFEALSSLVPREHKPILYLFFKNMVKAMKRCQMKK